MSRAGVSLCAIVKNERDRLPLMIRSARPVVSEVIVVDTGSTDDTQTVARELGARVFEHPWTDDFAAARNASLEYARGKWILVLDADDRLLPAGVEAIRRAITWPLNRLVGPYRPPYMGPCRVTGYSFGIREQALDGTIIGTAASSGRLFPRSISRRYSGRVHEEVLYRGDRSKTCWGLLPGEHIVHTGYDPSLMPAKYERNLRLLKLRLAEDEHDIWAMYYLAMTYRNMGDVLHACDWAQAALQDDRLPIDKHMELRRLEEEIQREAGTAWAQR